MKIWPFSLKKKDIIIDTPALVEQLLQRLDAQDKQLCQMESLLSLQNKRIDRLIQRIDAATGRGAA